jgi:hypothetical protein
VIKFFVAIFRDLTFWVEKFNFRPVKTSMLFSATEEKKTCNLKWKRLERAANPHLALHGLVLLGQDGADGNRKRFRITDPFRIPVALAENSKLLSIGLGPDHD